MFKLCILALAAGAMALPKIEHRADNNAADNDLSNYYAKVQEYVQNDRLSNYFKPAAPASSAGSEVQADSQQYQIPNNFNQYQSQMQNLQGYQNNQYFKDCLAQNGFSPSNIPNFGFPTSGSDSSSSSSSSASGSNYGTNYSPDKYQEAFKKCQSSMQSNIPNNSQYQIPGNWNNPFSGSSSSSSTSSSANGAAATR